MAKTTWTDASGKTWSARLTIAEANRLKSEDDIDLLDPQSLSQLVADPLRVVWLLCRIHAPQISLHGITEGDFAELCTENETVANAAAEAMVEALADFFTRLRKPAMADVVRRSFAAATNVEQRSLSVLAGKGDAALERVIAAAMDEVDAALEAVTRGKAEQPAE